MATIKLTPETIARLKFIDTKGLQPGDYEFPDFLVVGPQRTGTTWLQRNLDQHPQIFMSVPKELFFFNKLIKKNSDKNYSSNRLEWYSSKFNTNASNFIARNVYRLRHSKSARALDLDFKRFSSPMIKGEATASYAAMDEPLIQELVLLRPDVKIVMMMRNPIDRAWSYAKKAILADGGRSFKDATFEEFKKIYTRADQLRCARYIDLMQTWTQYVPESNFFMGRFDEIKQDPADLLRRVYAFLGVPSDEQMVRRSYLPEVINPGVKAEIPQAHHEFLRDLFQRGIDDLNAKFKLNW